MTDTPEISRLARGLRAGLDTDTAWNSIMPPMYLGTNFRFDHVGEQPRYEYGRKGNPTRDLLIEAISTLEGGAGGAFTSSGLGAITLIVASLLPPQGRVVAPHDCYGGTWRLLEHLRDVGRLRVDFVDLTDVATARDALSGGADLLWLETPSNPLTRITDLAALADLGHAAGALVVADNTFCSPLYQQPLDFGCDVVVHSTTKFINGHSDSVGGIAIARDPELAEKLGHWANVLGLTGSPFDAWLTLRGLRTLDARLRVHAENAQVVVAELAQHPAVTAIHHPSLPGHPGHGLATKQQSGFGSVFSFELAGGLAAAEAFCQGLGIFDLAESLGGVESLVAHPATMTHAAMPPEVQAAAGITAGLLRLSVGVEPAADLVADLRAGLRRAVRI